MEFIERLLPSSGLYCTARLHAGGGFIHTFHITAKDALQHLASQDAAGNTMYLAQATYSRESYDNWTFNRTLTRARKDERRKERVQKQAVALRSFFIDIDCGPEKFKKNPNTAYETQPEAVLALRKFCEDAGFPRPALISSGHGLYAHWVIDQDVPAAQWKACADIFKQVLTSYGFKQDPSRTADSASVLRPVGTHNRKTSEIKEVKVIRDAPDIPLSQFLACLSHAAKTKKVAAPALALPTQFRGINDEFTAGIEGPPASAHKVAEKCAQVKAFVASKGAVSEPVWYNMVGLLRYTVEGEEFLFECCANPQYHDLVAKKIAHHKDAGAGPTTCAKISSDNPGLCTGCPAANKVKSPIVLGRPEVETAEVVTEEEEDLLPHGYRRSEDGLYWEGEDEAPLRFYPYDLYPVRIAYDQSLGFETVTVRHKLPICEEYREFTVRSALLHDQKTMLMCLADNHVQVSGKDGRHHMLTYLDNYMQKLRSLKDLSTLHSQMGWRQSGLDLDFILGENTYKMDGSVEGTGFARNIPEVAKAFHPKGDLEAWADTTKTLGLKGMEPFAFAFLAGAFGAPLMRFTGYAGAVVALVGHSGLGKTLTGEWVLSAYGDPRQLTLLKNDTVNALVSRLGLYGSLPLYLDEVSNIEGQELSDLLYRITQGRDKARLGRDAREKAVLNGWNTLAIASSNHSLIDKLSNLKADASAEVNRIMEIPCRPVQGFGRNEATSVYRTFHSNYGLAGPVYAQYLTRHQEEHRDKIDQLTKKIDGLSGAGSDERFWSAMSASAIYGGLVAKKLGLIKFEVAPVLSWLVGQIKSLRSGREDLVLSQVDVLGQLLDELAPGILVTSGDDSKLCSVIRDPRGSIHGRIMADKGILILSRASIKKYLERHYGSFSEFKSELESVGALVNADARRVLGSGTYIGGTQQPVWVIDLNCPALGRKALSLVSAMVQSKASGE